MRRQCRWNVSHAPKLIYFRSERSVPGRGKLFPMLVNRFKYREPLHTRALRIHACCSRRNRLCKRISMRRADCCTHTLTLSEGNTKCRYVCWISLFVLLRLQSKHTAAVTRSSSAPTESNKQPAHAADQSSSRRRASRLADQQGYVSIIGSVRSSLEET